jgi:hypothetical protein
MHLWMHFPPMPVGPEPCPDIGVLVVGGMVLNQNRSLTAVSPSQLLQEAKVGSGMEDMVLAIVEPCAPKFDPRPGRAHKQPSSGCLGHGIHRTRRFSFAACPFCSPVADIGNTAPV